MQYSSALLFSILFSAAAVSVSANMPAPGTSPIFSGQRDDDRQTVGSILRAVTVYRSGAEMIHTATASLHQGNNELVIDDLANNIDQGSIRVSCKDGITVLSVAYSTEYLRPETTSPAVHKLEDSIIAVSNRLAELDVWIKSDTELLDLLAANKSIAGSNGITVAELTKIVEYYRQKTIAIRTELSGYHIRYNTLTQLKGKLQDQVKEEEEKNVKTSGRVLLQLLSPLGGNYDFTVSYLTQAASWKPFYDLRVDHISEPLRILYRAKLEQTSGIDWKKVKLSLSTSTPGLDGNAPVLKTWFLHYIDPVTEMEEKMRSNLSGNNMLAGRVAGLAISLPKANRLDEVVVVGYGTERKDEGFASLPDPLYLINGKEVPAAEFAKIDKRAIRQIDVLSGSDATAVYGSRAAGGVHSMTLKEEVGEYVSVNDNQMDVTFNIDLPYDIPSNGKDQGVELKEYKVDCKFRYYSAPRLDREAYLLGAIPDWGKLNLLPGEANIIIEGNYVGKSVIDPGSTLDTLSLTLGRDKRIVVKKEKVADFSSTKFLGASKKQVFTYELSVRNNKKEAAELLLKDQFPVSSTKDIEEELLESSQAVVDNDTGILTWKVQLQPGETKKFRVSYSIRYPKDKIVNID